MPGLVVAILRRGARRRARHLSWHERLPIRIQRHALLVDPYFSRVDLLSVALGLRIQPDASRINDGLQPSRAKSGRDSGDARTFRSLCWMFRL